MLVGDLQFLHHCHVVPRHLLVNTHVQFLNHAVTSLLTAATLGIVHHVLFLYPRNALVGILSSEIYHAVRKISDVIKFVARQGSVGCMLVRGLATHLHVIHRHPLVDPHLLLLLLVQLSFHVVRHVEHQGETVGTHVLVSVTLKKHVQMYDASSLSQ